MRFRNKHKAATLRTETFITDTGKQI